MKLNKFKNSDKENPFYWNSSFEHHNPKVCNPLAYSLAKNLLNYGFEASNGSYGNDLSHRIDFQYKGLDVSCFLPNATKTNEEREEFACFSWSIEGENLSLYSYDEDDKGFICLTTEQLLIDSLFKALQGINKKAENARVKFCQNAINAFQESFFIARNKRFEEPLCLEEFTCCYRSEMTCAELEVAKALGVYWVNFCN